MSVTDYTLFRGKVYLGEYVDDEYPVAALTAVGNCPAVSLEQSEEILSHYSSQEGLSSKDKETTKSVEYKFTFETDEITAENIAHYVKGTYVSPTVSDDGYVDGLSALDKEYALQFVSNNPAGNNIIIDLWRVKLSPGGAFELITDEWGKLSFEGTGLKVATLGDAGAAPKSYYYRITMADTATG